MKLDNKVFLYVLSLEFGYLVMGAHSRRVFSVLNNQYKENALSLSNTKLYHCNPYFHHPTILKFQHYNVSSILGQIS